MHHLSVLGRAGLVIMSCMLFSISVFSQARMIFNGAIVTIADSAVLVIANGNANALTRTAGYMVSEGELNRLKWVIGTNTETYTVPWGSPTSGYLPVSFTTSSATGDGNFIFSTYPTGWKNSLELPTGVTNLFNNGADNSAFVLDRFWKISAEDYTSRPALSNLVFTYADIEHTEPDNTIEENNLVAQEWNDNSKSWEDIPPTGTVNPSANTVTVSSVSPSVFYTWWSLVDANVALPLRFLSFDVRLENKDALLNWTTADEVNVRDFSVQRRRVGQSFMTIARVNAIGGMGPHKYTFTDRQLNNGRIEYRILEKDMDGRTQHSKIISVVVESGGGISVYPNPVKGKSFYIGGLKVRSGNYVLTLYDAGGRIVQSKNIRVDGNLLQVEMEQKPVKGTYFLTLTGNGSSIKTSLIVD